MHEMPMLGGGAMSTMWARSPGQTWAAAEVSFLGMWIVMTVAMMLPSVAPALWRWRRSVAGGASSGPAVLTSLAGAGYLSIWAALGAAVYPLGVALAAIVMHQPELARVIPLAAGAVLLAAGVAQNTAWKSRHLASCRGGHRQGAVSLVTARVAWRHGVHLGVHCVCSCAGPMAALLALGLMEQRAMLVVTAAVTVERLAPAGERVARVVGTVAIAAGVLLVVRAVASG